MPTELIVILLLGIGASGFLLEYYARLDIAANSYRVPFIVTILGIGISLLFADHHQALVFYIAATVKFFSFVFKSRLGNRSSLTWLIFASFMSNGTFYLTLQILDEVKEFWLYAIPYVFGIVLGRTIGVLWAQYIEQRYALTADATVDKSLSPEERARRIKNEKIFWLLFGALVVYGMYVALVFDPVIFRLFLIITGCAFLQNLFYSLKTRVSQRGHTWLIAIFSLGAGITFVANVAFIFKGGVPNAIFPAYILVTTLGTVSGAFFSMLIERALNIKPDEHLKTHKNSDTQALQKTRLHAQHQKIPYIFFIICGGLWIKYNEVILEFLGKPSTVLVFPFPLFEMDADSRTLVIVFATLLFFVEPFLHTLASRAGNRDHAGYHIAACIPQGLFDFGRLSYIALNTAIPDLIPISICAGGLASLVGKDAGERIERWLNARMEIQPKEKPKAEILEFKKRA